MAKKCILILVIIAGTFPFSCSKKTTEPEQPSAVSTWTYPIPVIPTYTTNPMNIILEISSDSSFTLDLVEANSKKLYSSSGTTSSTKDSVYLYGDECMILDTVPDPDTLAALDEEICSAPVPLPHPQTATEWTIQTSSLKALLLAFPIEESMIDELVRFIPILVLGLEESEEE
jgi:hypothetical protein